MEVKFLGKGKNKVRLELVGETHTFANAIRSELWNDSKTDNAVYEKPHPTLGNPVLIVESEKGDPVEIIKKASKSLASKIKDIRSDFSKK